MAWLKKASGATGGGTPVAVTLDTTGADLLVAHATTGFALISGFTDSKSNTWQSLVVNSSSGGTGSSTIFYCIHPASVGTGHTVSIANSSFSALIFEAWSGADTTATLADQTNHAINAGGTTIQPGGFTTTTNGQLILTAAFSGAVVIASPTISSPFSREDFRDGTSGTNYGGLAIASFVQTTAGALSSPTWTFPASTSNGQAGILSFKAAAGGGATSSLFLQNNLTGIGSGGPFFQNPLTRSMIGWRKKLSGILIPDLVLA